MHRRRDASPRLRRPPGLASAIGELPLGLVRGRWLRLLQVTDGVLNQGGPFGARCGVCGRRVILLRRGLLTLAAGRHVFAASDSETMLRISARTSCARCCAASTAEAAPVVGLA